MTKILLVDGLHPFPEFGRSFVGRARCDVLTVAIEQEATEESRPLAVHKEAP